LKDCLDNSDVSVTRNTALLEQILL